MMRCNLCGCEIIGWGNNPDPLSLSDEDRCCDSCNAKYILPARLYLLNHKLTAKMLKTCIYNIRLEEHYMGMGAI